MSEHRVPPQPAPGILAPVRRWRITLLAAVLVGVLLAVGAQAAVASNCTSSAGDQQYIDPLSCGTPAPVSSPPPRTTTSAPSTPEASAPATSNPTAPAPIATPSAAPSAAPSAPRASQAPSATSAASSPANASSSAATATTATTAAGSQTLPYTGLDIGPAIAIGVALLGSGIALRRVTRSS